MNDAERQSHGAWTPDGETAPKPDRGRASSPRSPSVYDPEIPVNIYELGLIYAIEIADDGAVKVEMTLTAPACPSAQELPEQVRNAVMAVPGVTVVRCRDRLGSALGPEPDDRRSPSAVEHVLIDNDIE